MSKFRYLFAVSAVFALLVVSCENVPEENFVSSSSALVSEQACGETTWQLTAGQTIDVGTVSVSNDADNLYVTYELDYPGATFGTLHLWVGNSLANLPVNPQGVPVPGQFCSADGGACYDATGLISYTFAIPFSELNIVDVSQVCGLNLDVVTHAEVNIKTAAGGTNQETAFGGPNEGSGPRWWFYGEYSVCCDSGEPEVAVCETAFAKGGWVWTTSRKSNPENLPSLELTKNRWGWAINLDSYGETTYDLWAGAGLNNTSKGELVGYVKVDWDGSTAVVTYYTYGGYSLEEVHLFADDDSPTTLAPGQYGYLADFDPNASQYTFEVPLVEGEGSDGVWLIAHAVVCGDEGSGQNI